MHYLVHAIHVQTVCPNLDWDVSDGDGGTIYGTTEVQKLKCAAVARIHQLAILGCMKGSGGSTEEGRLLYSP